MASSASVGIIAFAEFEVKLGSRELYRAGVRVRLPDQSFLILAMLLERPGELVPRDEIRKRLWPGDTFVDFDHGLNNAVNRLREALGDSAEKPRFVETLPRRGYRFVAPLESPPPSTVADESHATVARRPRGSPIRWILLAAALVTIAVGLFLAFRTPSRQPRTLVVLPLENLSGDPSQQYLAEGITDALTTDLARLNSVRVISRRSADHYAHTGEPLKKVAAELGADLVLEGSVIRAGDRIRITAQLVDAQSDNHLWAQSYDRRIEDILELQAEVALSIATQIAVQTPAELTTLQSPKGVNRDAYDHYLHGRFLLRTRSQDSYDEALREFQEAARIAPQMALAYVGLAQTYNLMGFSMDGRMSRDLAAAKAKDAAHKALALDPESAEAHAELGFTISRYDFDAAASEQEFVRAIEINPNDANFHHWYGIFQKTQGRLDEAASQYEEALRLDPMSPNLRKVNGMLLLQRGRRDEAIAELQRAVELGPTQFNVRVSLAYAYLQAHRFDEAIAEDKKAVELSRGAPFAVAELARVYAGAGNRAMATQLRAQLENQNACPYLIALVNASLFDKDATIHALENGMREKSCGIDEARTEQAFDFLRSDPRFIALLHKLPS